MSITKRLTMIFVVLVLCVGCDQTTKFAAESYLPADGMLTFLGGVLRLQLAHNHGAFLGLGASLPEVLRDGFFSLGVGIVLLGLLGYALFSKSITQLELVAFAMLFAGGVSNLADRLMGGGSVIDFINIGFGSMHTGIFNVADMVITLAALMLFLGLLAERNKTH
ncbi:MAG: signal peptidase II [Methylococcales bacterium]